MTDQEQPLAPPPLGTIEFRANEWVGRYLNRTIRSENRNRVLCYLRTVELQEQGMTDIESVEKAMFEYPVPPKTPVPRITWVTAPKTVVQPKAKPDLIFGQTTNPEEKDAYDR